MSDMNDFSEDENFHTLCHNEDNPISSFGGVDFSDDEHGPENIFPQLKPPIFMSLSMNLLSMAEMLKIWSLIFL
jgi:hypothetical protein